MGELVSGQGSEKASELVSELAGGRVRGWASQRDGSESLQQ